MGKKKAKAKDGMVTDGAVALAEPEPAAADTGNDMTLPEMAEKWLAHLDRAGSAQATIDSYRNDLRVAIEHFGESRRAALITPVEIAGYFECDAVTKLRSGKPKSQISIDKTRRILRLAFAWAADRKLVDASPVPALERRTKAAGDGAEKPAAKPRRARKP